MKKYNNIVIVLVALLTLAGCKEKMRELNTNLDLISDTQVQYMFTGAFSGWENVGGDDQYGQMHALMQYISHYASKKDNDVPNYRNPSTDNDIAVRWASAHYSQVFGGCGNKVQNMIYYIETQVAEADREKYEDVYQICKAMMAYMQYNLLESYGATVYDEAFKAISEGNTEPHYQYMQDVVADIDKKLADAVTALNKPIAKNAQGLGANDYFTGWKSAKKAGVRGCVLSQVTDWNVQRTQWKKFFNMARLEIAWKLNGRLNNLDKVFAEVAAVQDGYFKDVDDAFYFNTPHDSGYSDGNIWITAKYCMSENFINLLIKNNDPRLPLLARPNGATDRTSAPFAMMQKYFPEELAKYDFLDGKHPYIGLNANPENKSKTINENPTTGFISHGVIYFNDLPNPMAPEAFKVYLGEDFDTVSFCPKGETKFNTSILIGSEVQYRYFLVCAGKNNANHDYSGNGIKGLGDAYIYKLQADGSAVNETNTPGQDLHLRKYEFSYPRQCFLLSMIGKSFAGKDKVAWYNEGVKASFQMLQDEAHRMGVQAYTGGDTFNMDRTYPDKLTQVLAKGEVTYNYPYSYTQAEIDEYLALHPFSKENLYDQFYIYGYLDPNVVYTYWRKTGLPEFKEHATRQAADAEPHIYLEQPYEGEQKLTVIRRNCLPDRNTINKNYMEAKLHLQEDPAFGQWLETDGKIWWESCSSYPTGWDGIAN